MRTEKDWQHCNSETFWREVATCSHVVQLYENDAALLSLLEDFVVGGVSVNDCIIVIATEPHLVALRQRMVENGMNVDALCKNGQYFPLDAEEVLSRFMVNDWPDALLFDAVVSELFNRVRKSQKPVRAFGEMVAVLWDQGNTAATVRLEHLWNDFFEKEAFSLFCAYPKNKFPEDTLHTLTSICKAHSKIISNSGENKFDLSYKDVH